MLEKRLLCLKDAVSRKMDINDNSDDISFQKEEQIIRNYRKLYPYYKVVKNFAELCSSVLREVEVQSDEIGYLGRSNSSQTSVKPSSANSIRS